MKSLSKEQLENIAAGEIGTVGHISERAREMALELLQRRAAAEKSVGELVTDAISKFSEMNIGFPTERFKTDFVIRWVFVNYADILSGESQKMLIKYANDMGC